MLFGKVAADLLTTELLSSCTCTVFAILLQIWQVSRLGVAVAVGVGICLRISKYERQMGIPSLHSLSLTISALVPASLHGSLLLWADGPRRILGHC